MKSQMILMLLAVGSAAGCASRPPAGPADSPRLGAIPEAVLAADAAPFIEADLDRDRRTTTVEWNAWIEAQWKIVAEDDPAITKLRFTAWTQSLFGAVDVGLQFGSLSFDRDLNRVITADEFATELLRRFELRDANDNDGLERDELWVRLPPMPSMPRPPFGAPPGGMPPGGPPGGGRPPRS